MRLYIFKSDADGGLQAFTADPPGSKLPARLGPWNAVGVVRPELDPPHNLSREAIQKAIHADGFQLWRMKS